jgi:hypothetical protein
MLAAVQWLPLCGGDPPRDAQLVGYDRKLVELRGHLRCCVCGIRRAGASASNKDAATAGNYYKGMATFTVTKGGPMAGVSIGGQKFSYKRL